MTIYGWCQGERSLRDTPPCLAIGLRVEGRAPGFCCLGVEAEVSEELAVVVAEVGGDEEVGAVGEGFGEGGLATPLADGGMVAFGEDFGDGDAAEFGGAGVVGVVEEAGGSVGGAGRKLGVVDGIRSRSSAARRMTMFWVGEIGVAFAEGFVFAGVGVAEDAGEEAYGGVEEDGCGQLAAGEDVVADGELVVAEELGDAFVDAFVTAADEDDAGECGEAAGGRLGEALALGGEEDDGFVGGVAGFFGGDGEGFEAVEDGLGLEDHALAAAEGTVVDGAVAVVGEGAEVVGVGLCDAGAKGAGDDAVGERAGEEAGKDGEDVEAHKGKV